MKKIRFSVLLAILILTTAITAQQAPSADVALRAATHRELVEGNLPAAIAEYKTIVARFPDNHPVVAKALLQIGRCYEKLGAANSKEAQQAYERVLNQFADQPAAVAEARTRLTAMRAESTGGGVNDQLLFTGPPIENVSDVSADGRYLVVYDKSWVLRDWRSGETLKTGPFGDYPPHLSPDGRRVAYVSAEGKRWQLKVASIDGSSARVLAEGQGAITMDPTDWSPDGARLLVPECRGAGLPCDLGVMSVADGSIRRLGVQARRVRENGRSKWSPDGGYIVYVNEGLFVISVDGTSNVQVAPPQPGRALSPLWAPDGRHVLYVSNRGGVSDLLAIEIKAGKPVGAAVVIKAEIGNMTPVGVTRDGTVFWSKVFNRGDVFVVELDPVSGRPVATAAGLHERGGALGAGPLAWSPDGGSLAFVRGTPGGPPGRIVIRLLKTGEERVVPGDYPGPRDMHWLPDGSLLVTVVNAGQRGFGVETIDPSTGQRKTVLASVAGIQWWQVAVSPDGRAFYYQVMDAVNGEYSMDLRLMRHDIGVAEDKVVYRARSTGQGFFSLSASPDGRQLAFTLFPEKGNGTCPLMTLTLEGGLARTLPTSLGYNNTAGTAWTPDSQSVFAVTSPSESGPSDLVVIPAGGGAPRAIPGALGANLRELHSLTATRDGRRLAFATGDFVLEAWMTRNMLPKAGAAPGAKPK